MREKNKKIHIYQTKCPIWFIKSQEQELDCLHAHPNKAWEERQHTIMKEAENKTAC